jgi:hypothetical protein
MHTAASTDARMLLRPIWVASWHNPVASRAAGRESDGTTIFVKGFSREFGGEDEVRQALTEAFADCGEVSQVGPPSPVTACHCILGLVLGHWPNLCISCAFLRSGCDPALKFSNMHHRHAQLLICK